VVLVGITKKGLALLADLDPPTAAVHRRQLGHLSRTELADLNQLLTKARQFGPARRNGRAGKPSSEPDPAH
jgi:hypothetical protein